MDLARLAHDLKNPLTSLRLRVELDVPEEAAPSWYADIEAIEHVLHQYATYAEVSAGADPGEPVDVGLLLQPLEIDGARPMFTVQAAGIEPGSFLVPRRAGESILWNLVHNALRHGRAPIGVQLRRSPQEARLLVLDAGAGIAADQWDRALQPFQCLQEGHSGHPGLGLAIVNAWARACGGRVVHQPFDGRSWGIGVAWPSA